MGCHASSRGSSQPSDQTWISCIAADSLPLVPHGRESNGTPLQYSCLENPMDGGAWWAAVHGVAKNRTRLGDFTFHFHALEKEMATHSRWVPPSHSVYVFQFLHFFVLLLFFFKSLSSVVEKLLYTHIWASLVAQTVKEKRKNLPAMQETQVWSLDWEDPLENGMATYSSILACRIPWTKEPGRLQSMGSQRVGHDWATNTFIHIYIHTYRYIHI